MAATVFRNSGQVTQQVTSFSRFFQIFSFFLSVSLSSFHPFILSLYFIFFLLTFFVVFFWGGNHFSCFSFRSFYNFLYKICVVLFGWEFVARLVQGESWLITHTAFLIAWPFT